MSKNLVIILDACRFDALKEELPHYTENFLIFPFVGVSRSTPEYYRNITFVSDFTLVTANPTVLYVGQEQKWKRVIHTKSIDPEDNLQECLSVLKEEDNVLLHLIPPHAPWQGEKGKAKWQEIMRIFKFSMNLKGAHKNFGPSHERIFTQLGPNEVREYYYENLRFALDAIFKYYERLPKPFLITADHGELLGEDGKFGHPEIPHFILQTIPIAVIF